MARKFKAELKDLLNVDEVSDDEMKKQQRFLRNIVMSSVTQEMKKLNEGLPTINPDGSFRSLNMPGLLAMLELGHTPILVDLLKAMITTPHRAKEDA